MFNGSMVNILWAFVAGERFRHDDPKLKELVNAAKFFLDFNPSVFGYPIPTPILRLFSNVFAKIFWNQMKQLQSVENFVQVGVSGL